ncbi:tRNA-binding protein [Flavobacterium sp. HSC-61S13]|uniref:tRNA-binding protein n=1 Tax=Flavobacterium sp. HSC-61S13 TaxID=2910963 RepID=UPI0020A0D334|nr:tRNA-binding protein [Flavobacterium sp. HSC-61S13]MCP1995968.1 tRNA-binding protein [Flavobacterium sp. HSC-61S13]
MIEFSDFEKIDMRVGTVLEVLDFEKARNPSYKLFIDFGEEIGVLKSSAQITTLYNKEELVGKQLIAVVNFPKKQIADFRSECLVLGVVGMDKEVILIQPGKQVANGWKIG